MPDLDDILAVILGGGRGSRLYPLTKLRSKPAVPIAGKYRLIDIPISNCIHSGIYRVGVLTQFNSVSLNRHVSQTYVFDSFHTGWVQIWAAEQTSDNSNWYQGTADAVRKQMYQIRASRTKHVLILAGDHLYRMDYSAMARFHWENDADVTVAVQPVARSEASRLGILKRDGQYRITQFAEKPKDPQLLDTLASRDDPQAPFLASMGIYLFKTEVLFDLLASGVHDDFGGDVIPSAIQTHSVFGFDYDGYWEDIGTIRSFYETNLAMTQPDAKFNLFDPDRPVYTRQRHLPGSVIENSVLEHVLMSEGCCIKNAEIRDSVIGLRSQVGSGTKIIRSIIMGADFYEEHAREQSASAVIPVGIGDNCSIEGAIIDKNARIGHNVIIRPFPRDVEIENENWVVKDGVVVIPKAAIIPNGFRIEP